MNSTETKQSHRTLKDYLWLAARGFCMGAADVVPGVSGGTLAFILGIYEELLHAIHAANLTFIRRLLTLKWRAAFADFPWRFLLAVGLGIAAAIFTLAEGLSWALHTHPSLVWAFFFGLVLASAFMVRKRVARWSFPTVLAAILSAAGAYLLVGLAPAETPDAPWFLFLSGAVAICAMILPGISGAFILVLLGKYQAVLDAVVHLDFVTLFLVAAGAATGLVSFVRLLRWLLGHYHDLTIAALTGLMLGSLRKVWPWKTADVLSGRELNLLPASLTLEVGLALALAALGFTLVLVIEFLASRRRP